MWLGGLHSRRQTFPDLNLVNSSTKKTERERGGRGGTEWGQSEDRVGTEWGQRGNRGGTEGEQRGERRGRLENKSYPPMPSKALLRFDGFDFCYLRVMLRVHDQFEWHLYTSGEGAWDDDVVTLRCHKLEEC